MAFLQFADPKTPESTATYLLWFTEPIASLNQITVTPNTLTIVQQVLVTPFEISLKTTAGTNGVNYAIALNYTLLADGSIVNETVHLLVQSNV